MIRLIIIHYKLYVVFLPYLIFWISYVSFAISLLFNLYTNKHKVIYFPKEFDSNFLNFVNVYPKRLMFLLIYFLDSNCMFSRKNLINFLKAFSFVILIGVPFVFIKILYFIIKNKNVRTAWRKISEYQNLKIVLKGKIIRNMKRATNVEYRDFFYQNKNKFNMGLQSLQVGNKTTRHAASFDKESNVGSLFTSKKQLTQNNFEISSVKNSHAYAQVFDKEIDFIPKDKIENKLNEEGIISGVRANYMVSNLKGLVMLNYANKQKFIDLNEITKQNADKAIKSYGSKEDVLKAIEYAKHLKDILFKSEFLLYNLANSDKNHSKILFSKNKDTYKDLEKICKESDDMKFKLLFDKINSFL